VSLEGYRNNNDGVTWRELKQYEFSSGKKRQRKEMARWKCFICDIGPYLLLIYGQKLIENFCLI